MATQPAPLSNPPATPADQAGARFFRRAATFSLLAPFLAVAISSAIKMARAQGPAPTGFGQTGMVAVFLLFIFVGAVMGIVSLFGMRKYGPQGILWKAVIGLAMFGTLSASLLMVVVQPPPAQGGAAPSQTTAPAQP